MNKMPDFGTFCLSSSLLLIVVGLSGIALNMLGVKVKIVNQEKRLVIYRLGVFRDVVGPGPVFLNRHLDKIEREINVRSEQKIYSVGTYFMHGMPFGYMLTFWRRVDLKQAAGANRDLLVHLAQFSDTEREDQIQAKLHEAFLVCVPLIEQAHTPKMPAKPTIFDSLVPILPGVPACEQLFSLVLTHLQKTLPTIGVIPDIQQSTVLAVKSINIPPELMRGFSQGRSLTLLREQFPDLSKDLLLHAFSMINGLDPHMTRLYLEGSGAAGGAIVRIDDEGEVKDIKVPSGAAQIPTLDQGQKAASPKAPPSAVTLSDDELTDADWQVLKPTPRLSGREQSAA